MPSFYTRYKRKYIPGQYIYTFRGKNTIHKKKVVRKQLPKSLNSFLNSIRTYLISNLNKQNQSEFKREIEIDLLNYLKNKFSLTKRFKNCENLLKEFEILTFQYKLNCISNANVKSFIKSESFEMRVANSSKVKSTIEDENGNLVTNFIEKNL